MLGCGAGSRVGTGAPCGPALALAVGDQAPAVAEREHRPAPYVGHPVGVAPAGGAPRQATSGAAHQDARSKGRRQSRSWVGS